MKPNLPVRFGHQSNSQNNQYLQRNSLGKEAIPSRSLESQYIQAQIQSRTIINDAESLSFESKPTQRSACKVHPNQKATYFLSGQPWMKLCKQCALNKALCGHQIQKDLSQQQFEKKIMLTSLIQEIKSTVGVAESEGKYLGELAEKVQKNYSNQISKTVKTIDELLHDLNRIRQSMYALYEDNVSKKINQCYERQSHLINSAVGLKKHLQNIQSNYSDLIAEDNDNGEQFARHVSLVRNQIQRTRKGVFLDYQKQQLEKTASNILSIFLPKINELKQKTSILDSIEFKDNTTNEASTGKKDCSSSHVKKQNNERQTFTSRRQMEKNILRRKSNSNIIQMDQNSQAHISVQTHRPPNLSLRSNSKKLINSSAHNSCKKPGLKESKASLFNSLENGHSIFPY